MKGLTHKFANGKTIYCSINNGYLIFKHNNKVIKLHRYIMEEHLQRKLKRFEIVHHIDKNKFNNNISNLLITTTEEHSSFFHRGALGKKHSKSQWNKLSDDTINKIISLHKKGFNYSKIGRKLNISNMSVRRYILISKSV